MSTKIPVWLLVLIVISQLAMFDLGRRWERSEWRAAIMEARRTIEGVK